MKSGMCGVALTLAGLLCASAAPAQQRSLGVKRAHYVLEVDLAQARALAWAPKDASDGEVVASAARIVRRRFNALEREFQLQIDAEKHQIELSMPQVQPRDPELCTSLLKSFGVCEFLFVASDELVAGLDLDLERERAKLTTWRAAHPELPLEAFHALDPSENGPHRRLLWAATDFGGVSNEPYALLLPDILEDCIGVAGFASASAAQDQYGYPALAFELLASRHEDLARFTSTHQGERFGTLIEGKLRSAPSLNAKLTSGGLIFGRFSAQEATRLAETLTKLEGPLRLVEAR